MSSIFNYMLTWRKKWRKRFFTAQFELSRICFNLKRIFVSRGLIDILGFFYWKWTVWGKSEQFVLVWHQRKMIQKEAQRFVNWIFFTWLSFVFFSFMSCLICWPHKATGWTGYIILKMWVFSWGKQNKMLILLQSLSVWHMP